MVKAQEERNRIAEQQMWDAQRHNREMEAQARRQADAVKQQEEVRRRGAPIVDNVKIILAVGILLIAVHLLKK